MPYFSCFKASELILSHIYIYIYAAICIPYSATKCATSQELLVIIHPATEHLTVWPRLAPTVEASCAGDGMKSAFFRTGNYPFTLW